jgi:diguanylate cyclase (GGDEF)-like protein
LIFAVRRAFSVLSWLGAVAAIVLGSFHAVSARQDTSPYVGIAAGLLFVGVLTAFFAHKASRIVSGIIAASGALLLAAQYAPVHQPTLTQKVEIEFLYGLSQLVLVIGLFYVVRRRLASRSRHVAADGFIVALGAWLISWVLLVRPSIATSTATALVTTRGLTVAITMLIVFLLALLAFSDSSPTPASGMLGLAVGLDIVSIVLRAISSRGDITISSATVHAPLIMAIALSGAALMHPSARTLLSSGVQRVSPPLMTRLVTTTGALLVPIIVVASTDPDGTQDRMVRTLSVAVLACAAMVRIIQSVRANANTQAQLMKNALTDSLTGLPNRLLMLEHIQQAVEESWNTHRQPTLLFIDVDRFKNINDSLGHSTGDEVLTHVARRLLSAIPDNATVGRIAGDEFVILDPTTESPTQSVLLAESVLDAFRDPMSTPEGDMFVTASIGVAYAPRGVALQADDLMRHADTAMYRAKDAGRNCIALFDDSMIDTVTKRLEVETALYRALERNELLLVHQPIIDINLGVVVGFEALMRWDRGDAGVVAPNDFIPIAEETGTIVPLGSWAINDALQQLRRWIDTDVVTPSTTMSVNVSPRQLHDPQFVTVVKEALQNSGIQPEQLWLEVTETVMITEPAQALSSLQRLNSLGVRIAIDDFGTGYSSLSLLQQFPIQCIKIDRAFVQNLENEEGTRNIVRTIIAMASAMGADIVAEGIEYETQMSILSEMNCQRAQGYYISKPVSVEQIPQVVESIKNLELWRSTTS